MNIPISAWSDYEEWMLGKNKCPDCEGELVEACQFNGADDFDVTGLHCVKCGYQFNF